MQEKAFEDNMFDKWLTFRAHNDLAHIYNETQFGPKILNRYYFF